MDRGIYIYIYIYIWCVYIYECVYTHIHTHAYIYIYIYMLEPKVIIWWTYLFVALLVFYSSSSMKYIYIYIYKLFDISVNAHTHIYIYICQRGLKLMSKGFNEDALHFYVLYFFFTEIFPLFILTNISITLQCPLKNIYRIITVFSQLEFISAMPETNDIFVVSI